jgi:hypothetical protein
MALRVPFMSLKNLLDLYVLKHTRTGKYLYLKVQENLFGIMLEKMTMLKPVTEICFALRLA